MSTGCDFHAEALTDLAAGRLDRVREARVREHVSSCASCRDDLEVLLAVAAAEAKPPVGLEARIRVAVRQSLAERDSLAAAPEPRPRARGREARWRPTGGWRPWALPLAAAATVAVIWIGLPGGPDGSAEDEGALAADYTPWGAWPGDGPEVAGAPVLTELTAEDLELLLERMDP